MTLLPSPRSLSISPASGPIVLVLLLAILAPGLGPAAASAQATDLFFSEYVEGSGNDKALEVYNGTGATIDLSGYQLERYANGSTSSSDVALTGMLADGDVWVGVNSGAAFVGSAFVDQVMGNITHNGDDAYILRKLSDMSVVDSFGQVGNDPGSEWPAPMGGTQDNTLRRKPTICMGDTNSTNAFDGNVEWDGFGNGVITDLGMHTATCMAGPTPIRLLLTEVVVTPTTGEFIEIHNPTGAAIDLSDVYLTDATFAGGSVFYYNIVTGTNAGGGGFADFFARFPDGAMIGAGEYQTIALTGDADFNAAYSENPTYELFEDGAADAIPDMREALPGSIMNQGGLTNDGEVVILFTWDGTSDLVQDLDYALWGDKVEAVVKTGITIDGPDADMVGSAYQDDTMVPSQDVIAAVGHAAGMAWNRIDLMEGTETQSGGNGSTGADETSENLGVTWAETVPTPNGPAPAVTSGWVINEILYDPAPGADPNGDGTASTSQDEFVEIVNTTGGAVDISGWTVSDAVGVRHTFPMGTIVPDGCGVLVFGAGAPMGDFGGMLVQTASTGQTGFNNGGDTVTLNDGMTDLASETYPGSVADQSIVRDPDLVGAFVAHSGASGSGGATYSPGFRIDGTPFAGCPQPISGWVINEILYDPAAGSDPNGDGNADTSQDEFVEIVNATGGAVDISGWTLSDGAGLRHTFPMGTTIEDGCGVLVFGAGTPAGIFGGMTVQTASEGLLGLNNGGDSITLSDGMMDVASETYGDMGDENQSITRDPDLTANPFVLHTTAMGSGGAAFSPGTRIDGTIFGGCTLPPAVVEIHEIQGATDVSPFAMATVTTNDNIVTAVGPEGFFIQTPDARVDADPDTSQGIYVYTGGAPGVSVGDQVDVTGMVEEFFGFTEITGSPSVMVDAFDFPIDPSTWAGLPMTEAQALLDEMGARRKALPARVGMKVKAGRVQPGVPPVLPTAVVFDATTPSPNQPQSAVEYERYEGMRISIPAGTVCSGNQGFGSDPIAEVHANATGTRCLREPGIEYPGLPMLPVWDLNPEVFELDLDALGGPSPFVNGGTAYTAEGVLAFEFGDYEVWTTNYTETTPMVLPRPVRAKVAGEMTIGSLNLFRLFDDVDDPADGSRDDVVIPTAEYQRRLDKFALYILDVLGAPDVLGVQEVESLQVLRDLAAEILSRDPAVSYTAHLVEGNDIGTIDVGFLTRSAVAVDAVTQQGAGELLSVDSSLLHDRPPLLLEGRWTGNGMDFPFAVQVNHTRSLSGIDNASSGSRVRQKRLEQAQSIAQKVQDFQAGPDSAVPLVVIGDLNAFQFTDGYVDVIGQVAGDAVAADNLVSDTNITSPTLTKQVLGLPAAEQYSFNFNGNAQVLDHALTTQVADIFVRGFEYGRANSDAAEEHFEDGSNPLYSSDHDGFVLFLVTDRDADGVPDDVDNCPDTPNADQADGDGDGFGDVCDNCPMTANADQADVDLDGVGDVCDNCPSNANADQADGDSDGVGDVCDNCPSNANADQADGDSDGVGDVCDNCPSNANADQADVDLDGVGDVCDACDDSLGPVFTVLSSVGDTIVAQVEDCSGIQSLSLGPGSTNLRLTILSGVPGDPTWTFEVGPIDPLASASGTVTADGTNLSADFPVNLGGTVLAIPTVGEWGLMLLALLLLGAGWTILRRPH